MSLTQFAVMLDLYYEDYIGTENYTKFFTDYPAGRTLSHVFRDLCGSHHYIPGWLKASLLSCPVHRYIHGVLSKLVKGHGDGTCSLSRLDLLYPHLRH